MKSWLLIHQSHRLLEKNEKAVLKKAGLTPRKHAVLLAMANVPGPPKISDIAVWLDRNANGISRLVDRMERDGLLTRMPDNNDRRASRLKVTAKGKQCHAQANELFHQLCRDVFEEFSEAELVTLSQIMERLRAKNLRLLEPDRKTEVLQVIDE